MGDPSIVYAIPSWCYKGLQKPKSAIFKTPLWIKIFSGLISLCIILCSAKILKPFISCLKYNKAAFYPNGLFLFRIFYNVPPLQN